MNIATRPLSLPSPLLRWNAEEYASFSSKTQILRHAFHELPILKRSALIDLLHHYPRHSLQAFTMGSDPTDASDWRCVDIADDTSGEAIWRAVEVGRLWLNVMSIEEHSHEFGELIDAIYRHLDQHCPHLRGPVADYSTLLISSPGAQVYYHMDADPNTLWHLRGSKRVWIYPALDTRFISQDLIEDIFASKRGEEVPFDLAFDQHAFHHVLQPGEAASWPQNGPHRIENIDLNVSLSTSFHTPLTQRRKDIQQANRSLLRPLGIHNRSMDETGLLPSVKRYGFKALRASHKAWCRTRDLIAGEQPADLTNSPYRYITDLQLDPDSPGGVRRLPKPIPASFSILRYGDHETGAALEAGTRM